MLSWRTIVNVLSLRALILSTVAVSFGGAAEPCAGEDTDADTCASRSESYLQTSSFGGRDAAVAGSNGAADGADLLRQHGLQADAGGGNTTMANFHPCPMVSALIANGKVVLGPSGEWSSHQAGAILTAYLTAAGWPSIAIEGVKRMLITGFFGMDALSMNVTLKVPEWGAEFQHTIYTGVRLAQIKDHPLFYQGACNAHGFMREDPDCGKPGPHPVVFDELARRLNKSDPEATWSKVDTAMLCSTARDLFFALPASCSQDPGCLPHECREAAGCTPMAYRRGHESKSICEAVYGVLPDILGAMTTAELKAILTEDRFPAAFADKLATFPLMVYQPSENESLLR